MPTVHTDDGVAIAAHDFGGDGPDLLLAHATGFHAHVWLPVAEHLRRRFHCVAFDGRGHGDSGIPADGDFTWPAFARDALAVVDTLGLVRPFAVGHSAGGALLVLAEQAMPDTFRALYCWEPIIATTDDPPPPRENMLAVGARRRREGFASREDALARFAGKPPFSTFAPEVLQAYVDYGFDDLPDGTVRLKCRGESEARTYEQGFSHDAFRRLGSVRCPVFVECGEHTTAMRPELCDRCTDRLPAGRSAMVPDLGHFGPMEAPAVVAARVAAAFAAVPSER